MAYNAEGSIDGILGWTYCSMDAMCFVRNALGVVGYSAELAKASAVASSAFISIPFIFFTTGVLYLVTGINGIRDAYIATKVAEKNFRKIRQAGEIVPIETVKKRWEYAAKRVELARAGVWSWCLYFSIGCLQLATLSVMATSAADITKMLGYNPLWVGKVAFQALQGIAIGSGILFMIRGGWMAYRSYKTHQFLSTVRSDLRRTFEKKIQKIISSCAKKNVDVHLLKKEIQTFLRDIAATSEKLDEETKRKMEVDLYTGKDIDAASSWQDIVSYINEIDEALYGAILGEKIAGIISISMIVGGILTLASAFCSSGNSVILIELISASIFMCMEGVFCFYDSSSAFAWLQKKCYNYSSQGKNAENWIGNLMKEVLAKPSVISLPTDSLAQRQLEPKLSLLQ